MFPPKAHMENGVHLYGLMNRLRRSYREGNLAQDQITAMESLPHWNWEYQDSSKRPQSNRPPKEKRPSSFDERIAILKEHIAENSGTIPSLTHKSSENHPVGAWAGEWRRQWREGTLTEREIATLEAIPGWEWDPFNDAWETNFLLLLEYSKEHGHVNIPLTAKFQGVNLGSWIGAQRTKRKPIGEASSLDLERQTRLESLPGWNWTPKPGRRPKQH
jgi:hypothetical protein